jgi:GTPase SAR1 family protein
MENMHSKAKFESFLKPEARTRFIEDTNFDSEKLNTLIQTGYKKTIDQIKNSSIVLVVGCTGSGKSTLINYLLSNKISYVNQSMDVIAIAEKSGDNYPEIGHDVESKTIFPEVFHDKVHDLAYCDFPGFFDNRPYEERVSISINTQSAIMNSKNVEAIIVVLSWTELTAQRGKLFKDLNKLLDSLICDFESILPNIIFFLSKTHREVTSEDFYNRIDDLVNSNKKYLEEKFKNFANKLKQKWDPDTKERESAYKFLSAIVQQRENFVVGNFHNDVCRNHITTLLKSMKMKSITKDNFNFDRYDVDRMRLNNFISFIAYHGLNHIKNYLTYPKVNLSFANLT